VLQFGSIYSEVWSSVPCCLVVSNDLHCNIEYAALNIVHSLTKLTVQLSISITLSTESFNDVGEKKKKRKKKKKKKRKQQQRQNTIAIRCWLMPNFDVKNSNQYQQEVPRNLTEINNI